MSTSEKVFLHLEQYIYAQHYWIFGLCPLSGIPETREHNDSKTASAFVFG
jgi:hypothetical protein